MPQFVPRVNHSRGIVCLIENDNLAILIQIPRSKKCIKAFRSDDENLATDDRIKFRVSFEASKELVDPN